MHAPGRSEANADPLLAGAEAVAEAALRELPEALVVAFDEQLRFTLTAGQVLSRLDEREVCGEGQPLAGAFAAELWEPLEPLLRSALEGETRSHELWTSERTHCVMVLAGPLPRHAAGSGRGLAVLIDVTARRDALERTRAAGFEDVFERAPLGTGLLDLEGRWLLVNRALCEITGYSSPELIGTALEGLAHPDDVGLGAAQQQQLLAGEIPAFHVERRCVDAAGEIVSVILSMSLVRDRDGGPLHYVAQVQDISERMRLEEEVRALADHDPLTGLRSRRLFEHDLKLQVARSQRYGEVAGLLVIDLDRFSAVERRHGPGVGEELLGALARGLTRRLRQTDLLARLGGDRFAVLLPHIDEQGMNVVADGLARVIPACSVEVGVHVLHPSATIGAQLIDDRMPSAAHALAAAERAMRDARTAKRAQPV